MLHVSGISTSLPLYRKYEYSTCIVIFLLCSGKIFATYKISLYFHFFILFSILAPFTISSTLLPEHKKQSLWKKFRALKILSY